MHILWIPKLYHHFSCLKLKFPVTGFMSIASILKPNHHFIMMVHCLKQDEHPTNCIPILALNTHINYSADMYSIYSGRLR